MIDVVSTLPRSYPGHVLLTEDLGVYNGIDDGDWPGKHFLGAGKPAESVGAWLLRHGFCSRSMTLKQRFPPGPAVDVDALIGELHGEPEGGRLQVGDARVVEFLTKFDRTLLAPATARRHPESPRWVSFCVREK